MFSLISKGKQMPSKSQSFSRHQYRSLAFCPLSNVSLQPLPLTRGVFRGGGKGGTCPPPRIWKDGKKKGKEKSEEKRKRWKKREKRGKKAKFGWGLKKFFLGGGNILWCAVWVIIAALRSVISFAPPPCPCLPYCHIWSWLIPPLPPPLPSLLWNAGMGINGD